MNHTSAPIHITLTNNLRASGLQPEFRRELMEKLKFPNPKWIENQRLGRWNRGTARELHFYDTVGKDGLWLPRGYIRHLIDLCRKQGLPYELEDKRRSLDPVPFSFIGELRPFQQRAARDMQDPGRFWKILYIPAWNCISKVEIGKSRAILKACQTGWDVVIIFNRCLSKSVTHWEFRHWRLSDNSLSL